MFEFIAGIILGSVLGVVADRLWGRVEKQPKFQLTTYYFGRSEGGRGIGYRVKNIGKADIPDYQIGMFHPARGTFNAFLSKQEGALQPDQFREHEYVLAKDGKPEGFVRDWILRERDTVLELEDVEIKDFSLRIEMKNSKKILFESSRIGNAIALQWLRTAKTGECGHYSWEEQQAMCTRPPIGLRSWLEQRREKKRIEQAVQEAKQRHAESDGLQAKKE